MFYQCFVLADFCSRNDEVHKRAPATRVYQRPAEAYDVTDHHENPHDAKRSRFEYFAPPNVTVTLPETRAAAPRPPPMQQSSTATISQPHRPRPNETEAFATVGPSNYQATLQEMTPRSQSIPGNPPAIVSQNFSNQNAQTQQPQMTTATSGNFPFNQLSAPQVSIPSSVTATQQPFGVPMAIGSNLQQLNGTTWNAGGDPGAAQFGFDQQRIAQAAVPQPTLQLGGGMQLQQQLPDVQKQFSGGLSTATAGIPMQLVYVPTANGGGCLQLQPNPQPPITQYIVLQSPANNNLLSQLAQAPVVQQQIAPVIQQLQLPFGNQLQQQQQLSNVLESTARLQALSTCR